MVKRLEVWYNYKFNMSKNNWWALATDLRKTWSYDEYFNSINIGVVDEGFSTSNEDLSLQVVSKENILVSMERMLQELLVLLIIIRILLVLSTIKIYIVMMLKTKKELKDSEVYKVLEILIKDYHCEIVNISIDSESLYLFDGKVYQDKDKKQQSYKR